MKKILFIICFLIILPLSVSAIELEPPQVPEAGEKYIPPETESFGEGLLYIFKMVLDEIAPSFRDASRVCLSLLCVVMISSFLTGFSDKSSSIVSVTSSVTIAVILLTASNSLVELATNSILELSQYSKLLLPVMAAGLAAQGCTTSSGSIYAGALLFCNILTGLLSKVIVPLIYIFLCLAVCDAAINENIIKELKKFIKWLIGWSMKIVLYAFSGYMGITKIVTGSVDASAIRATKLTISGMIPVVGKIISDSSEMILVSADVVKNGVGIYGLLAVIALLAGPIVQIGAQHILLKLTWSLCGLFGVKGPVGLIGDWSKVMAMLLGAIGTMGLLILISIVCLMKGVA